MSAIRYGTAQFRVVPDRADLPVVFIETVGPDGDIQQNWMTVSQLVCFAEGLMADYTAHLKLASEKHGNI